MESFVLNSQAYQLLYERDDNYKNSILYDKIDLTLKKQIDIHEHLMKKYWATY